jgi:hypothetical protein
MVTHVAVRPATPDLTRLKGETSGECQKQVRACAEPMKNGERGPGRSWKSGQDWTGTVEGKLEPGRREEVGKKKRGAAGALVFKVEFANQSPWAAPVPEADRGRSRFTFTSTSKHNHPGLDPTHSKSQNRARRTVLKPRYQKKVEAADPDKYVSGSEEATLISQRLRHSTSFRGLWSNRQRVGTWD